MRLILIFFSLICTTAYAKPDKEHWTTGLYFGMHQPVMLDISNGLQRAPIIGSGKVVEDPLNNSTPVDYNFLFESSLDSKPTGVKTGFTLSWDANPTHSLIFSIGAWENSLYGTQVSQLPIQQTLTPTHIARKSITSYTEYALGWRFNFVKFKSLSLFSNLSIHEIFDIDYKDDIVFTLNYDKPSESYHRVAVMEAQTASMLLGGLSLGLEYTTREMFSINISGGLLFGNKPVKLQHSQRKSDFLARDEVDLFTPFYPGDNGELTYLPESTTHADFDNDNNPYQAVNFSLAGWQMLIQMSLTF